MTRDVLMCRAGKEPAQCGFNCASCLSYDVCIVDYCDICNQTIDDWAEDYNEYHFPETGKDICKKCREKIMKESESYARK